MPLPTSWDKDEVINLKEFIKEQLKQKPDLKTEDIMAEWEKQNPNKPVPQTHKASLADIICNARQTIPRPTGWDEADEINLKEFIKEQLSQPANLTPKVIRTKWQELYPKKPVPQTHKAWLAIIVRNARNSLSKPTGWDQDVIANFKKFIKEQPDLTPEAISDEWQKQNPKKPLPESHKTWAFKQIGNTRQSLPKPDGWDEADVNNLRKLAEQHPDLTPEAIKAEWQKQNPKKLLPESHSAWASRIIYNKRRAMPKPSVGSAQTTSKTSQKRRLSGSQAESDRFNPYARSVSQVGDPFQGFATTSSTTSQQRNKNFSSDFAQPSRAEVSELYQMRDEVLSHTAPMSLLPVNEELLSLNVADQHSMMAGSIAAPFDSPAQPVTRRGSFSKAIYTFTHPNGDTCEARDLRDQDDGSRLAFDSEFKLLGPSQRKSDLANYSHLNKEWLD